jgi:lipid-A-disaccharide synthase
MWPPKIFVVAGEESGSKQIKVLLDYLRQIMYPTKVEIFGIGSSILKDDVDNLIEDPSSYASIGILSTVSKLPYFFYLFNKVVKKIKEIHPDLVILVDFPEFNLRLLKYIKKHLSEIKVAYFIPPTLWLWGKNRLNVMRKADIISISLPQEELLYAEIADRICSPGYPVWDLIWDNFLYKKEMLHNIYGMTTKYVVSFLPGVRPSERAKHLPIMLQVAKLLKSRLLSDVTLIFSVNKEKKENLPAYILPFSGNIYHLMRFSDIIVAKSGLSVQEAALIGTTPVVIYKTDILSYIIARFILKLPYVSLINLINNRKIVPEFLQYNANPPAIAEEVISILKDKIKRASLEEEIKKSTLKLGKPGATYKVAKGISILLQKKYLRSYYIKLRANIPLNLRYQKSAAIKNRLLEEEEFKRAKNILAYASYKSEVQTWGTIATILAEGKKKLFLPKIDGDFIGYTQVYSLEDLEEGQWGILQPSATSYVNENIDLVLVPGIAFSEVGARLGHGRGYYDKLLSKLNSATFIGLAYKEQIADFIPTSEKDVLMHKIITDEKVISCRSIKR